MGTVIEHSITKLKRVWVLAMPLYCLVSFGAYNHHLADVLCEFNHLATRTPVLDPNI